eukprot:6724811-Prymnesium_polylepis.1
MKPNAWDAVVSTVASVSSERRSVLNASSLGVVMVTLKKGEPAELVHGSIWTQAADGEHVGLDPGLGEGAGGGVGIGEGGGDVEPIQITVGVDIICATEVPSASWTGSRPVACAYVAGAVSRM